MGSLYFWFLLLSKLLVSFLICQRQISLTIINFSRSSQSQSSFLWIWERVFMNMFLFLSLRIYSFLIFSSVLVFSFDLPNMEYLFFREESKIRFPLSQFVSQLSLFFFHSEPETDKFLFIRFIYAIFPILQTLPLEPTSKAEFKRILAFLKDYFYFLFQDWVCLDRKECWGGCLQFSAYSDDMILDLSTVILVVAKSEDYFYFWGDWREKLEAGESDLRILDDFFLKALGLRRLLSNGLYFFLCIIQFDISCLYISITLKTITFQYCNQFLSSSLHTLTLPFC